MQTPKDVLDPISTRGDLRRLSASCNERESTQTEATERLFKLWAAMGATWGNAFFNQYGDQPDPVWINTLAGFTEEQLMEGYYRAKSAGLEFPPNLSVFLDYVRGQSDWEHRRQSVLAHDALNAPAIDLGEGRLLPPPSDDRTPQQHLDDLKGLFNAEEKEGHTTSKDQLDAYTAPEGQPGEAGSA